jgi:hypothetical protein
MMVLLVLSILVMQILAPAATFSAHPFLNALFNVKLMHNAQNGVPTTTSMQTANFQSVILNLEHVRQ